MPEESRTARLNTSAWPPDLVIRPAVDADCAAIWPILQEIIAAGDTFTYAPDTDYEEAYRLWMAPPGQQVFVAETGGVVVGSYFMRPNQPGLGSHVANAGFAVNGAARGQGVGRAMCRHAIEQAARCGYRGMQFNIVVVTNEHAVRLWLSEGFRIVGTIPGGFRHARLGYVDIHIMYRAIVPCREA